MPLRTNPPEIQVKAASDKIARKLDRQRTRALFRGMVGAMLLGHFLVSVAVGGGIEGYLTSWKNLALLLAEQPLLAGVLMVAVAGLYKGIEMWRHPEAGAITLPPFPPVPDLRWENSIYVGSGWTRSGKQPGEVLDSLEADELLEDPHVILQEKGLFGNIHTKGGVGSGKTSTLIMPFLHQGIAKYPKPLEPSCYELGPDGRYLDAAGRRTIQPTLDVRGSLGLAESRDELVEDEFWNPYVGLTENEARAKHDDLLREHVDKKWGFFVIDPKGDITAFVKRAATLVGRGDDVVVLEPDGQYTYNPLLIEAEPLTQAKTVAKGIEAVSGQSIQQYWEGVMVEWLSNALALLRATDPSRITFRHLLRLARNESVRTHLVGEAEAILREAQEEKERLTRMGGEYRGVDIDGLGTVIEFFRDWDNEDADEQQKRAVVSSIKAQATYFVDGAMAPFLSPEMPATFKGFLDMIDKGKIVVLRMPLSDYAAVAQVLGILVLSDAQQAARARINRHEINQERVIAFVVDEISAYLNDATNKFIAMNRQSRVCFLAAHQSQGQLVRGSNRGFETEFNDNLRTKISFNTPNADAARREVGIFGSRPVYRQSVTESQSFAGVEREAGEEGFSPVGREAQSASVRYDEVEKPWFAPVEFMEMRTGECVVMEFDGQTTLPPRKILAPAYYLTPSAEAAGRLPAPTPPAAPHPIVLVGRNGERGEYLSSALTQVGFVAISPLTNAANELEGFKFVTPAGTVVASVDSLDQMDPSFWERLTEPQIQVVLADMLSASLFFTGQAGVRFDRVLDLIEVYQLLNPDSGLDDISSILGREFGEVLSLPPEGSWAYHCDIECNEVAIAAESRRVLALYARLGYHLSEMGEDTAEELFAAARERIDALVEAARDAGDDDPEGPDGPDGLGADPVEPEPPQDEPALPFMEDGDPFYADHYPESFDRAAGGAGPGEIPTPPEGEVGSSDTESEPEALPFDDEDSPSAADPPAEPPSSGAADKPGRPPRSRDARPARRRSRRRADDQNLNLGLFEDAPAGGGAGSEGDSGHDGGGDLLSGAPLD